MANRAYLTGDVDMQTRVTQDCRAYKLLSPTRSALPSNILVCEENRHANLGGLSPIL